MLSLIVIWYLHNFIEKIKDYYQEKLFGVEKVETTALLDFCLKDIE